MKAGWPTASVIIGKDLAERFGWKIGDRVPLTGTIYQPKQGKAWEFNVSGIYDGADAVDKTQFFFRYDYLDENRAGGSGLVGWYVVKIADAAQSVDLSRKFDAMFANSTAETKTTTEKAFAQSFANQIGDIGAIMTRFRPPCCHVRARGREHDGAVGARRTSGRRAQDARIFRCGDPDAGPRRVALHRPGRRRGWPRVAWLFVQRATRPMACWQSHVAGERSRRRSGLDVVGPAAGVVPATGAMRLKITDALRRA